MMRATTYLETLRIVGAFLAIAALIYFGVPN